VSEAGSKSRVDVLDEVRLAMGELFAAERRLRGRDRTRHEGLSFAQMRTLFRIGAEDEITVGELAKMAEVTPATITGMLDGLERDGMVSRRRSDQDRRVVLVCLTEQGRELLVKKREMWRERWQEKLGDLDDAQLESAATTLHKLAELFDEL
jgi:MarR family transcriptional regulator, organic hydroperoxide resistance regulator